jgi:hypothetical protein
MFEAVAGISQIFDFFLSADGLCAFLSRVPITFDERVSMVSSFFTLIGFVIFFLLFLNIHTQ